MRVVKIAVAAVALIFPLKCWAGDLDAVERSIWAAFECSGQRQVTHISISKADLDKSGVIKRVYGRVTTKEGSGYSPAYNFFSDISWFNDRVLVGGVYYYHLGSGDDENPESVVAMYGYKIADKGRKIDGRCY